MTKKIATTSLLIPKKSLTHRNALENPKRGIYVCRRCRAYLPKKSWHPDVDSLLIANRHLLPFVQETICPACEMIEQNRYQGKVFIVGMLHSQKKDILALVKAFGIRAYMRNVENRVINTHSDTDSITITLTGKALAAKLAQKVRTIFHLQEIGVVYSSEPSNISIATVTFS